MARYATCVHRGSLEDALETENPIDYDGFRSLIGAGLYKYYCYDARIKANRYLLRYMDIRLGLPAWLHEYLY